MHQFVQQKGADMETAHKAAGLSLQAAQMQRIALYNSKSNSHIHKQADGVWLHSSVIPRLLAFF